MRDRHVWFRTFIVLIVALLGASAAYANGAWVIGANAKEYHGYSRELVVVDYTTGQFLAGRDIILAGYDVMKLTAVATDPATGTLFAGVVLWDRDTSELVTIDPVTGIATSIGDMGHAVSALSFAPDGTLYAVSGNRDATPNNLYTIDPSTAAATLACAFGTGYCWSQAIVFDETGLLYHASAADAEQCPGMSPFESYDLATSCTPTPIGFSGESQTTVMGLLYTGGDFLMTDTVHLFDLTTTGVLSNPRTLGFTGHEGDDIARGLAVVSSALPFRDLGTTVSLSPNPGVPASTTVATISVSNPGLNGSTGVTTTVYYTEGFFVNTAQSGDATCTHPFSGRLVCDFGEIAADATETVDLSFNTLASTGTAPMEAVTVSNEWDTNPYDNIGKDTLTLATADIAIAMSTSKSPAQKGKPLTYNITASNAGPGAATNVYVSDQIPTGLTYQSASGATCSTNAGYVICALGTLESGDSLPFSLTFAVDLPGKSTISNTVLITSATSDTNTANNSATIVKKVAGKP